MLISIIVPCYNVENLIDRCVESIVKQSIGIENLEVLLINDASTDNTLSKLMEWYEKYPQSIKVITYEKNIRQGGARNKGLKEAACDYIGFVDSDDWIHPDMYKELYTSIKETDADVAWCRNDQAEEYHILDTKKQSLDYVVEYEKKSHYYKHFTTEEIQKKFTSGVWGGLYKKAVIVENNVFFPENLVYEDNYWREILNLYISKECYVDRVLYYYFININSTVRAKNNKAHFDRLVIEKMILDKVEELGVLELFYRDFCDSFVNKYYLNSYHIFLSRFTDIPNLFREMKTEIETRFPDYKDIVNPEMNCQKYLLELLEQAEDIEDDDLEIIKKTYSELYYNDVKNAQIKNRIEGAITRIKESAGDEQDVAVIERILSQIIRDEDCVFLVENELVKMIKNIYLNDDFFIYILSVLMELTGKKQYYELFVDGFMELPLVGKMFYYYQLNAYLFENPQLDFDRSLLENAYDKILEEILAGELPSINNKQAKSGKIVVVTNQFINENHAPTHSTLERATALKQAGKEVTIIGTDEFNIGANFMMHNCKAFSTPDCDEGEIFYNGEALKLRLISEKDFNKKLQDILSAIEDEQPEIVVYVGGDSFVADLIDRYYKVCKVATVFSAVPYGHTSYLMIGRDVKKEDELRLKETKIIGIPFKFELKQKKNDYTKTDLGIDANKFVGVVIGSRLDTDVTDEFLAYLDTLDIFTLFIGRFDSYEQRVSKYKNVYNNSKAMGQIEDVNGVVEATDLYINPKRMGGGFSVIEAMNAGVPAISINYGDVSAAAGDAFCVENYEQMIAEIRRYKSDSAFYMQKQEEARERAKKMTSKQSEFVDAIEKIIC